MQQEQLQQLHEVESRHPRHLMSYSHAPPASGSSSASAAAPPAAQPKDAGTYPEPGSRAGALPAAASAAAVAPTAAAPGERPVSGGGSGALQRVLLFERNGLQHGGFMVPTAAHGMINALSWSADSELLAVVVGPGGGEAAAAREAEEEQQPWAVQVRRACACRQLYLRARSDGMRAPGKICMPTCPLALLLCCTRSTPGTPHPPPKCPLPTPPTPL